MEKWQTYRIKGTELEIRDFGPEFDGKPVELFLPGNEKSALDDLQDTFSFLLKEKIEDYGNILDESDMIILMAELKIELAKAAVVPMQSLPKIYFHELSGKFYALTGEMMFFVPKLLKNAKSTVSH
jgi:hypothetical protein